MTLDTPDAAGPRRRSPLELLALQMEALFTHDSAGDLLEINEHGPPRPAPRIALGRTADGDLLQFRADVSTEERAEARASVASLSPWRAGVPSDDAIEALGSLATAGIVAGPGYSFALPLYAMLGAMQLYPANAVLLHPSLATLAPELKHRRPIFAVFRDGAAISVCYSARSTPEAAEAGVETALPFRGQGAAAVAVACWAAAIRESRRIPLYSTAWENTASRAVAAKLELGQFSELIHAG